MFHRWWRWIINPMPQPGQIWEVDGLGKCRIKNIFYNEVWITPVVWGQEYQHSYLEWKIVQLRLQADPAWDRGYPYKKLIDATDKK